MRKEKQNIKKSFDNESGNIPDNELLWQKIEENLLTDDLYYERNKEFLHHAIDNLPEIKPTKNIWNDVSDKLQVKKITHIGYHKFMYTISGIAALLIIGLFISNYVTTRFNENITYSKELVPFTHEKEEVGNYNDLRNRIIVLCENKPVACQNKDFINLKNKLDELIIEKQRLNEEVLLNSGSDIHTYQELVDNQIKNIEHQIVTYLTI